MEEWTIKSSGGYEISGRTDFASEKSGRCIVLVHGYSGGMYENIHVSATEYFTVRGYDVVRFELQSQTHRLRDCTLQTHADDLNDVLAQKCGGYEKLFLSGHSYGGPTVMIAQPKQATALCLWDPSFNLPALWEIMEQEDHGDFILLNFGGVEVVAGKAMAESRTPYDTAGCLALSEKLNIPIQVIGAEDSEEMQVFKIDEKSYHSAGHGDNRRIVIEGSDHCFRKEGSLPRLLEETHQWFERY